jgi:hypothetical protein
MKTSEGSAETAGQPAAVPNITYAIDERNVITRTDKDSTLVIGVYEEKTQTLVFDSEKARRFHPAAVRFLNEKEKPVKSVALKGAPRDDVNEAEIPKRPKMDPQFGDKTPAVVEWYRRYKPEEYKVRYGIKGPGTVTKLKGYETDPKTGEKRPIYEQVDAIIATRKTHLTEKVEASDGAADEEGGDE